MDESIIESLKELDDLEFEIVFVDSINKKLKKLDAQGIRMSTMLFMYMSIVESLKKYKQLVSEGNRQILHNEVIDLIINKGDSFLSSVAHEQERSMYVYRALSDIQSLVKDLMSVLKNEMLDDPKYAYLRPAELQTDTEK